MDRDPFVLPPCPFDTSIADSSRIISRYTHSTSRTFVCFGTWTWFINAVYRRLCAKLTDLDVSNSSENWNFAPSSLLALIFWSPARGDDELKAKTEKSQTRENQERDFIRRSFYSEFWDSTKIRRDVLYLNLFLLAERSHRENPLPRTPGGEKRRTVYRRVQAAYPAAIFQRIPGPPEPSILKNDNRAPCCRPSYRPRTIPELILFHEPPPLSPPRLLATLSSSKDSPRTHSRFAIVRVVRSSATIHHLDVVF